MIGPVLFFTGIDLLRELYTLTTGNKVYDWFIATFVASLLVILMLYAIAALIYWTPGVKGKVLYSWKTRPHGKAKTILFQMTLALAAFMFIIGYLFPGDNDFKYTDPVRFFFGIAGFLGAFIAGYALLLRPRKYAITTEGITLGVLDFRRYPWSKILHYEILENERVMVLDLLSKFLDHDYIPLDDDVKQVQKVMSSVYW